MTTTATAYSRTILTTLHGREIGLDVNRSLVVKGDPDGVTFSAASGAANICNVTIQVVNNDGTALAGTRNLDLWVSDAATGAGLAAHANTSELTCSTGTLLQVYSAGKAWRIMTDATGKAVAVITDTAKTAYFIAALLNHQPFTQISTQLATGNFG